MEIWQANTHGRYTHPNDDNVAPLDENFEGFAVIHSDDVGCYNLKTIKPVIDRALEKDPDNRFANGAEFAAAVRACLAHVEGVNGPAQILGQAAG